VSVAAAQYSKNQPLTANEISISKISRTVIREFLAWPITAQQEDNQPEQWENRATAAGSRNT
jgi:predicted amino acid-binding ACT domain protein